jgi:hypothetical protein
MSLRQSLPPLPHTFKRHCSTAALFVALSDLEEYYNIKLGKFPDVVTIGSQSSGKSSVIEGICGETILPKAMKLATLKPMHLTTIHSSEKKFKVGDKIFTSAAQAAEEIDRANNNSHVKQINVIIWSPDVYNARLIDLPGLFVVAGKNDAGMPKMVKELSAHYLQDMNTIPLIVHAAPSDPATNAAIKLVEKYGREGDSLGIITKVDMLEQQRTGFIEEMLKGETYPMGHGYCAVVLRNDKDVEQGMTVSDKMKVEHDLMIKMGLNPSGVNKMRQMISEIQFKRIKEQIPKLVADIDTQINNLKVSQDFLHNLLNNDQKEIAVNLRIMIEKLVSSSVDRAAFEDKLKKEFKSVIGSYMGQLMEKHDGTHLSQKFVNTNILLCNYSQRSNPTHYKEDEIKELFSYGLLSPIVLDNNTLTNAFRNESDLGLVIPMIDLCIDDPQGRKRAQWGKYLNDYFSALLKDDSIHLMIYQVTEKLILDYIHPDGNEDVMTKKFAEYMVKEIGNEAYASNIKYSITAMINIEKRPQVSIFEVARYVTQMHQKYFTFYGTMFESLSRENRKLRLEVYGEEWNAAYLKVVTDKLTENCYRNVAVNLLDRMVEKLLEMCIDMFNRNTAMKEQGKVREKTNKLIEIRNIVASFDKSGATKVQQELE